jgi:micrococcal nuclease
VLIGITNWFYGAFFVTAILLLVFLVYNKEKRMNLRTGNLITLFLLSFIAIYILRTIDFAYFKQETEIKGTGTTQSFILTPAVTQTTFEPNGLAKVIRVVDGDTVEIENGKRLRLIGIDAPEKGDCYFQEATNKVKELLEGQEVVLEKDVSEIDRYGRLLRYIWRGEILINEQLVKEGYASSYAYPPDIKYQDRIISVQEEARDGGRGMWSACDLQTSNAITQSASPSNTGLTSKANGVQFSDGACKYSCLSPDRDCSDFSTHAEAQEFFDCCGFSASYDPMRLDRSGGIGNGLACESLPQ